MIDGKRVLAIVPARSGSKGLPGKNVRMLQGRPLLAWPILAARASECVDRVICSTDDADYAELARQAGAEVPFLRPAELAADTARSLEFILHAIDTLAAHGETYDYVVLLEPTSPLTEGADIDTALADLQAARDRADAIVGVTLLETVHPAFCVSRDADGLVAPYGAASFANLPRRQDLPAVHALDGSLYISTPAALREHGGFAHARTLGYVTARHKALEIDDIVDFWCVEGVMAHRDELPRG